MTSAVATGSLLSPFPQAAASTAATAVDAGFASAVDAVVTLVSTNAPALATGTALPTRSAALPIDLPLTMAQAVLPVAMATVEPTDATAVPPPLGQELRAPSATPDLPVATDQVAKPVPMASRADLTPLPPLSVKAALPAPNTAATGDATDAPLTAPLPVTAPRNAPLGPPEAPVVPADIAPPLLGRPLTAEPTPQSGIAVAAPTPVASRPVVAVADLTVTGPTLPPTNRPAGKAMPVATPTAAVPQDAAAYRAPLQGILVAQTIAPTPATISEPADPPRDADSSAAMEDAATPASPPQAATPAIVPLGADVLASVVATPVPAAPVAATPPNAAPAPRPTAASDRATASVTPVSTNRPVTARLRSTAGTPAPSTLEASQVATATPAPTTPEAPDVAATTVPGSDASNAGDTTRTSNAAATLPAPDATVATLTTPPPSSVVSSMIAAAAVAPVPDNARAVPTPRQPADNRDSSRATIAAAGQTRPTATAVAPTIGAAPLDRSAPIVSRDKATDAVTPAPVEPRDGQAAILVAGDRAAPDALPGAPAAPAPMPVSTTSVAARHDAPIPPAIATVTPATEPVVTARPGQIGQELGVHIASRVADGGDQLVVRLVPAELGRIEVHMSFDDLGGLRAVIAADSPVALDMLRRDSADLSRSLSDAGVRSDAGSLRFQTDSGNGGGSPNGQPRSPWLNGDSRSARTEASATEAADPTPYRQIRTSGRYDLFA